MYLMEEPIPRVKAEAIRAVTKALANIRYVPKSESNLFPDYVLPAMNNLANHDSVVRSVLCVYRLEGLRIDDPLKEYIIMLYSLALLNTFGFLNL
mgnify:CR=1 FL=1